jgi:hypothetical protein
MKIQVIKPFKWCLNGNIHPSDFIEGIYDIDDVSAQGAIDAGWAVCAKDAPTAKEIELPKEIVSETAGWEETPPPFTEEVGSELSALPQEIALSEKIAEKPKKKYPKVGE